jgi:hypothetical protein
MPLSYEGNIDLKQLLRLSCFLELPSKYYNIFSNNTELMDAGRLPGCLAARSRSIVSSPLAGEGQGEG